MPIPPTLAAVLWTAISAFQYWLVTSALTAAGAISALTTFPAIAAAPLAEPVTPRTAAATRGASRALVGGTADSNRARTAGSEIAARNWPPSAVTIGTDPRLSAAAMLPVALANWS
ncbi:hypothetical protein [Fodinicola feengrottensis]|uniref:hypothetical protein n=1 Tax=Fodinicola feengrottensis TaxID=435914 RepID=UPI0031CF60E1